MELNEIGCNYLRALVDPFDSPPMHQIGEKRAPCKLYKVTRTVFGKVLGTGGIFIQPQWLPFKDGLNPIVYTDGTSTVSTVPVYSVGTWSSTGTKSTTITSSPFSYSEFTGVNTRMIRLVSAAVTVEYTGKAENIGGTVFPFSNQINVGMNNTTLAQVKQREDLIRTDFTNQKVCCFFVPYSDEVDTEWKIASVTTTSSVPSSQSVGRNYINDTFSNLGYTMGIFIEGQEPTSTTSVPFKAEICCMFEVHGLVEKQLMMYPHDYVQYKHVLSILDGPRAWVGSPETLKLNSVDYNQRPLRSSIMGGTLRQDRPLYYYLDLEKPIAVKDESGEVISSVSRERAKAFITGDKDKLDEIKEQEENVVYEGGIDIYKGNQSAKRYDDIAQTIFLSDIFNAIEHPTEEVVKKRKRSKSSI